MAFCPNCGVNNSEEAVTCVSCGASLQNSEPKKDNKKIIRIVAIIVVAVIALSLLFNGSPEDPIKNYMKAINTGKVEYLEKALPKAMVKENGNSQIDALEEMIEYNKERMEDEYGKGKYKYKVLDKEKLDKDELEEYQEILEQMYELNDIDKEPKVTAGYKMEVKFIYDGKKDEYSDVDPVVVLKVNGQWCMYSI